MVDLRLLSSSVGRLCLFFLLQGSLQLGQPPVLLTGLDFHLLHLGDHLVDLALARLISRSRRGICSDISNHWHRLLPPEEPHRPRSPQGELVQAPMAQSSEDQAEKQHDADPPPQAALLELCCESFPNGVLLLVDHPIRRCHLRLMRLHYVVPHVLLRADPGSTSTLILDQA